MNVLVRIGIAVAAGAAAVAFGSVPAQAAPASAPPATAEAAVAAGWSYEGYFATRGSCEAWGRLGESLGWWDDWFCVAMPVTPGGHGLWVHT